MRKERIILKHGVYIPLVGFLLLYPLPLYLNSPAAGILKTGNHAQRRRLSATRGTKQCEELSLFDLQVHILYNVVFAVPFVHMAQGNN